jgi:hypothetical protein
MSEGGGGGGGGGGNGGLQDASVAGDGVKQCQVALVVTV